MVPMPAMGMNWRQLHAQFVIGKENDFGSLASMHDVPLSIAVHTQIQFTESTYPPPQPDGRLSKYLDNIIA